ncbi:hypothetical protein L1987_05552 [Smallanthus sonchifolius]|uniref:Uncharacterized protein n=1 Tax=Smallanthus sonchifolius TaxID=185202 RepID=A0ACB9JVY8_9ASTR|nr:hypothetical protein L1987_05552 [Smallanthus sonchifolius]
MIRPQNMVLNGCSGSFQGATVIREDDLTQAHSVSAAMMPPWLLRYMNQEDDDYVYNMSQMSARLCNVSYMDSYHNACRITAICSRVRKDRMVIITRAKGIASDIKHLMTAELQIGEDVNEELELAAVEPVELMQEPGFLFMQLLVFLPSP